MSSSHSSSLPAVPAGPRPGIVPAIIAIGLLLRLAALALLWHAPLTSDAQDYCDMARRLLTGEHFVPYWPPGLPLFLAPFAALGLSDAALRIPMLLWWALATWAFLRLARALARCTGLPVLRYVPLPLLLFTLLPASIHLSVEPLTQLPVAALLLLSLSAALNLTRVQDTAAPLNLREALLLALSTGVMGLVRPSALALIVLLPALVQWRTGRWAVPIATVLLSLSLVSLWGIHVHTLCGAWRINTSNAQNLWDGNNPSTPMYRTWFFGSHAKPGSAEIHRYPLFEQTLTPVLALPPLQQPAAFSALTKHYVLTHPGATLLRTANRVRCFFGFDTFTSLNLRKLHPRLFLPSLALEAGLYLALMGPVVFLLAAAGRDIWTRWPVWTVLGVAILYAIPYWLSMSHPTYHYPVLAPLAILATLAWASHRTTLQPLHRIRGWVAVAVLLLIQVEWVIQAGSAT